MEWIYTLSISNSIVRVESIECKLHFAYSKTEEYINLDWASCVAPYAMLSIATLEKWEC